MQTATEPQGAAFSATSLLSILWDQMGQMYPCGPYQKRVARSALTVSEAKMERPLYALRVDPAGGVTLMYHTSADASTVGFSVFDPQGKLAQRYGDIAAAGVQDFQPDHEGGVYLLDIITANDGQRLQRLSRIGVDGSLRWSMRHPMNPHRTELATLSGQFTRLCSPDRDQLYLLCSGPDIAIGKIDPESGALLSEYRWDDLSDTAIIDRAGRFYYSRHDVNGDGRHALIVRDPAGQTRTVLAPAVQELTQLAGVDSEGRIYARTQAGIGVIAADGSTAALLSLNGAVLSADGSLTLARASEQLQLLDFGADGQLRNQHPLQAPPHAHFIHQNASNYYFYGNESHRSGGDLTIIDRYDGAATNVNLRDKAGQRVVCFRQANASLLPIASIMATPRHWQLDGDGNIYLALADPRGFHVLKLTRLSCGHCRTPGSNCPAHR
ncbi:hypothetical protein GJ699_19630 [Duganella sp. FT80W]|uniref:Uncharacterized protein n=1 Tax=Duganella guangzhouensis TaxID=2666084 RepID=A0A6I2L7D6_9BURK|nr:hypothetical protein [Duganella guangzhouensis]MRW92209.1 hypothetical protein [Duganella guangzhouensis]